MACPVTVGIYLRKDGYYHITKIESEHNHYIGVETFGQYSDNKKLDEIETSYLFVKDES